MLVGDARVRGARLEDVGAVKGDAHTGHAKRGLAAWASPKLLAFRPPARRAGIEKRLPARPGFYTGRGLSVAKSFGKYVEFATPSGPVKLGLYGRRALAKDAGVAPDGSGSHRLAIGGDAGSFTDPDGFQWETVTG
jgi:hypothetical protein